MSSPLDIIDQGTRKNSIDVLITLKITMLSQSILLTGLFEMSPELEMGVALYTRRVLIKSRADNILPKWLRFVKGTVGII